MGLSESKNHPQKVGRKKSSKDPPNSSKDRLLDVDSQVCVRVLDVPQGVLLRKISLMSSKQVGPVGGHGRGRGPTMAPVAPGDSVIR